MLGEFVLFWCLECGPRDAAGKVDRVAPGYVYRYGNYLPRFVKRGAVRAATRRGLFLPLRETTNLDGYWTELTDGDEGPTFHSPSDFAGFLSLMRARAVGKPWIPDDWLWEQFYHPTNLPDEGK